MSASTTAANSTSVDGSTSVLTVAFGRRSPPVHERRVRVHRSDTRQSRHDGGLRNTMTPDELADAVAVRDRRHGHPRLPRSVRTACSASGSMPGSSWRTCRAVPTSATTCSRSTWRWNPSRATRSPTGRRGTATCTWYPTARHDPGAVVARPHRLHHVRRRGPANARTGQRRPALDPEAPDRPTPTTWDTQAMAASELEYYLYRTSYREAAAGALPRPRSCRLVHRGLPPAPGDADRRPQRRLPAPPRAHRRSRSSRPRASSGAASTSSTSATPTSSPWPTGTS